MGRASFNDPSYRWDLTGRWPSRPATGKAIACLFALLAIVSIAVAEPPLHPQLTWVTKSIPLPRLVTEKHFPVIVPAVLPPSWRLIDSRMTWAPKNSLFRGIPARRAVCLFYSSFSDPNASLKIIEVRHLTKATQYEYDNVDSIWSQGYFFPEMKPGTALWRGSVGNTDYAILAFGVSKADLDRLTRSLHPFKP